MGQNNGILKLFYFDIDLKLYGKVMLAEIVAGNKITPGIGVTLLLGAVGSFYLIIQSGKFVSKLTQRKKGSRKPNEVCFMCNANIDFDDTKSFTICKGCERFVCKSEKCAEWIQSIGIWECGKCQAKRVDHTKASEWLLQQLNFRIRHPGPADLKNEKLFIGNESDDTRSTTSSITSNQRIKVREFIEELLASILKGSLDDVTVGPVSKNREYLPLWEGEGEKCPGDNHIELKRLIQSIIEEVSKIPELLGVVDYPNQKEPILPFFDPKKYEQLLATAVLNKVVETYRNNKNFPDNQSSGVHTDSELDNNHNVKGKRNLSTEKSISDNAKQISMAINDPKQKNDLNNFSRRASDTDESYLSDYIQKHKVPLPDLSSDSTSGGEVEDDAISLKSNGTDGTWEENWLFKKRQLKMSETSIAMLVPSPTEDIKALIGDKNADEVSDLSEAGSDAEDECDGHHKQFEKPTVISPESKSVDSEGIHPDSLTLFNSIPSSEQILSEAKNDVLLIDSSQAINNHVEIKMNGKLNIDLLEFEAVNTTIHKQPKENVTQKEIGKNEKLLLLEDENNCAAEDNELALITDDCKIMNEISDNSVKHLSDLGNNVEIQEQKIPVPSPRTHTPSSELSEKFEQRKPKVFARSAQSTTSDSNYNIQSEDSLEQDILIPGSIAEREHLKWKNAAPIANNPYSPDALKKRLSEVERKSQFSDLGRITPDKMIENLAGDICQETIIHPVLDSEPVDVNKYGRDYYINSAKFASGAARKRFSDLSSLSQSTDDEKSMLLTSKNLDKNVDLLAGKPVIRSHSFGGEQKKPIIENIFDEKPIKVDADDPILKKGYKMDYLSTENREFYLVPVEDTADSSSSPMNSPTSPCLDSLTFSEDSDTTRIYDLATGEMKILHTPTNVPEKIPSPPQTPTLPIKTEIMKKPITPIRPIVTVKPLSPETIRIFSPKNRNSITSLHEEDHNVIEKDLATVLPSVKQLAKQYTSPKQEIIEPAPVNKPTNFIRQISEDSAQIEEKPIEMKRDDVKKVYKPKYNPPTYSVKAPGHSITARSLSKQIREELKQNATDDIKERTTKRQPSPERPPSPIFVKGMTKNSIQFFENLKKKQ